MRILHALRNYQVLQLFMFLSVTVKLMGLHNCVEGKHTSRPAKFEMFKYTKTKL